MVNGSLDMTPTATRLGNNTVFALVSLFLLGLSCPLTKLRSGECRSWARKVVCIVGVSLWPGLRNRLSEKIAFFFRVGGGGGGGAPGIIVLPVESQKPRQSWVLQCVIGGGMGILSVQIGVLDVCLDFPGALVLYKLLVVVRGVKAQSVLGRVFSFCDKVQGVVRAGLPTSPAAMVMRPGSPLFKMVDPSSSPFTHWRLPDFNVVIVSIVNDIIRKLDLLRSGLRLGSSQHWQMYWFLLRYDFFWTQL